MTELSQEDIQKHVIIWMDDLFDKDHHPDSVKLHVNALVDKIKNIKLKNQQITIDALKQSFKDIENDIIRTTKENSQ
jgi:hypothetical protein